MSPIVGCRTLPFSVDTLTLSTVYTSSDPIAEGQPWTAAADFQSQVSWQTTISENLSAWDIFSAGVYFGVSSFDIAGLAAVEGDAISTVADFCSHNYPQSSPNFNLSLLMSHSAIATEIAPFASEFAAAQAKGKPYIMGETNSGKSSFPSRIVKIAAANRIDSHWRRRWH